MSTTKTTADCLNCPNLKFTDDGFFDCWDKNCTRSQYHIARDTSGDERDRPHWWLNPFVSGNSEVGKSEEKCGCGRMKDTGQKCWWCGG